LQKGGGYENGQKNHGCDPAEWKAKSVLDSDGGPAFDPEMSGLTDHSNCCGRSVEENHQTPNLVSGVEETKSFEISGGLARRVIPAFVLVI
jgi:hypothetical protein